jgi:excisionase family DNA binding protein
MATVLDQPFIPSEGEAKEARQTLEQLQADSSDSHYIMGAQSGRRAAIPESVFKLVLGLLGEISKGNAVMVMPMQAELTTIEAADFLNVSRPHLIKLLEQGEISFRMVGKHRRVLFEDLLKYKEQSRRQRLKSIAEMTAEDDQMFGMED